MISAFLISMIFILIGYYELTGPPIIIMFFSMALFFMQRNSLKNFAFTIWVFAFVSLSMYYPSTFGECLGLDLKFLIVPLIQIIMFGMGTTLNTKDFTRIFKLPWPVFIGMMLQFTVMPLGALATTYIFDFEPEVAAGVILIGSCPGGVASNLMVFLAGGDVALSVTMTSTSTLLSPVMTPLMMQILAGQLVPIDFLSMMFSILNMIIVPIFAGLIANKILYDTAEWNLKSSSLLPIAGVGLSLAIVFAMMDINLFGMFVSMKNGLVIGAVLVGVVAFANWLVRVKMKISINWMDKILPLVSMGGIIFIIAIITARSSEKLAFCWFCTYSSCNYTEFYWIYFRILAFSCSTFR